MLAHEADLRLVPMSLWRSRIVFAILVSICFISLLLATGVVWRTFFNSPPIMVRSLNPSHLGALCPGQLHTINNQVTIRDDVIVHYFVSVLDKGSNVNFPGTQRAFTDFLHPHPAAFSQSLSWTVPELPPGDYTRVFAVRKVSGNEDTVFVIANFTVPDNCSE